MSEEMERMIVKKIGQLPKLPQVTLKVLVMAESARVATVEMSRAMDQSLAAKVLKVANSAYYGGGGSRNINSIHHAIRTIGFDAVKEIVFTAAIFHAFHDLRDAKATQPFWQHSLECALIAKRLAWVYCYDSLDEAFLAGLTHDLGILVIQQFFPDQYQEIQRRKEAGVAALVAEKEVLGLTHAEISGKTAEHWAFPQVLVDVIVHHHDRSWINPSLGKILYYADQFTLGLLDFSGLLEAFSQEGMHYPTTWDSSDLSSVEMILHEERQKARSLLSSLVSL